MTPKVWGEAFRTTTVCIDDWDDGVLQGRIYNQAVSAGKTFANLTQFLQQMQGMLDDIDHPQAFHQLRSFAPENVITEQTVSEDHAGKVATFGLRILFRQNASWQGSVSWLEGRQEQSFRSALELIFLINSALKQQTVA